MKILPISSLSLTTNQPFQNNVQTRRSFIEEFKVVHPLFDKLIEVKIAKCMQHGQTRHFQNQRSASLSRIGKTVEAPSIKGSMKVFSNRPKTSKVQIDYTPKTARPKSINTIISKFSQPNLKQRFEAFFKDYQSEAEEQQLKPLFQGNRIKKK